MRNAEILKIYEEIDLKKERIADIDKLLNSKTGLSKCIDRYILNVERKHLVKNNIELLNKIQKIVMHQG